MNKKEYKEAVEKIEERYPLESSGSGISVKKFEVRTDSKGQSFLIGFTGVGGMPIISVPCDVGMPESIVKDIADKQASLREREKAALQERIRQEEINAFVAKRDGEIRQAAADKAAELRKKGEQSLSTKFKKMFGGE